MKYDADLYSFLIDDKNTHILGALQFTSNHIHSQSLLSVSSSLISSKETKRKGRKGSKQTTLVMKEMKSMLLSCTICSVFYLPTVLYCEQRTRWVKCVTQCSLWRTQSTAGIQHSVNDNKQTNAGVGAESLRLTKPSPSQNLVLLYKVSKLTVIYISKSLSS